MVYKETFETYFGLEKYIIKPRKKGVLIYLDRRENHVMGMFRLTEEGEIPLRECDYLVFDIPGELEIKHFQEIWKKGWSGLRVCFYGDWTEVSCHHPQVFHCGLLYVLERLKLIKVIHKVIPKEEGCYPYYVNAKGWRLLYNMFNSLREFFYKKFFLSKEI